jgi:hypothetical protein
VPGSEESLRRVIEMTGKGDQLTFIHVSSDGEHFVEVMDAL